MALAGKARTLKMDVRPAEARSLWRDTWRQMLGNRFAIIGMVILLILIAVAVAAPWLAPRDPYELDLAGRLKPPGSSGHLLGTDDLGRDVLSRLIYATRISLTVGLVVVSMAASIGVALGAIAGYYGGIIDAITMRLVDVLMAFPFLILAIAFVAVLGPSLTNMMIVLGGVSWIRYARLVRSRVLCLRETDFVLAAEAVGANHRRILLRHILPNCVGTVIVQATFGVASAILSASGLSFLGMGAQPPQAEWGAMLSSARQYLRIRPELAIAPGVMIMITVLAVNFIGDALRDAVDPRARR